MSFLAVIEALTPLPAILIAVKTRSKQRQQQQQPPCTCRCACDEDVNVCWVLTEMDRTRRCWLKNPAVLLLLLLPSLGWDGVTRDGQFRRRSSLQCRAWKKSSDWSEECWCTQRRQTVWTSHWTWYDTIRHEMLFWRAIDSGHESV